MRFMNNKLPELATRLKEIATKPPIIGLTALTATQLACQGEGFFAAVGAGVVLILVGGFYLATRPSSTERQINRMVSDAQKREDSSPYVPRTHEYLQKRGNTDEAIRNSGGDPSGLK